MSQPIPVRITKPPGLHCIAVVSKQNNPLLLETKENIENPLRYHYLAHMACDFVEERLQSNILKPSESYLGQLCMIDHHVIYGYCTNTLVKIFLIFPETLQCKEADLRWTFDLIHSAYIELLGNPFYDLEHMQMVTSKRFKAKLTQLLTA